MLVLQAPQQEVAFRGSVKPLRAVPVARRNVARAASCSAEERAPIGKAVAAAALAAALAFGSVEAAKADISGLTPCSESKGFAKRQKNELKALEKRLKKVSAGLVVALLECPKPCTSGPALLFVVFFPIYHLWRLSVVHGLARIDSRTQPWPPVDKDGRHVGNSPAGNHLLHLHMA